MIQVVVHLQPDRDDSGDEDEDDGDNDGDVKKDENDDNVKEDDNGPLYCSLLPTEGQTCERGPACQSTSSFFKYKESHISILIQPNQLHQQLSPHWAPS